MKRITASLRERVLEVVRKISRGQTLSYKEVARRAGNESAARAVGAIMRANRNSTVPCHRVILSSGLPGGYNGGREKKERLLRAEGAL